MESLEWVFIYAMIGGIIGSVIVNSFRKDD